jgi:hypothetical protein
VTVTDKDREGEERGKRAGPGEDATLVEFDQRTEEIGKHDRDDEDKQGLADQEHAGDQEQNQNGRPGAARGRCVNA